MIDGALIIKGLITGGTWLIRTNGFKRWAWGYEMTSHRNGEMVKPGAIQIKGKCRYIPNDIEITSLHHNTKRCWPQKPITFNYSTMTWEGNIDIGESSVGHQSELVLVMIDPKVKDYWNHYQAVRDEVAKRKLNDGFWCPL